MQKRDAEHPGPGPGVIQISNSALGKTCYSPGFRQARALSWKQPEFGEIPGRGPTRTEAFRPSRRRCKRMTMTA
jgi:hypothetical protein